MDTLRARRKAAPASVSTKNHEYFYPAKEVVNRRLSATTDFDDTDFEASDSDEESLQQSLQSLAYDSNTTLSTPELPTPDKTRPSMGNARREPAYVRGPNGPHLFRNSTGSTIYEPSTAEIDLYFERSPLQSEFTRSVDTPTRFPFSPRTPKALTTVHPDVSQVTKEEILNWKPSQVAHWLYIAGYNDAVIERFIINDITGSVLLSLQAEDLKELSIHSFGMRHQIMASIEHLKTTMQTSVPELPPTPEPSYSDFQGKTAASQASPEKPPSRRMSPERRSYTVSVSPNGEILSHRAYGQQGNDLGPQITPAESVSIVGIEQVLPKPHSCSKGEKCSKYKRQQRMLEKLAAEFPDGVVREGAIIAGSPGNPLTAQNMLRPSSNSQPSVVASSDIFGPSPPTGPRLSEAALSGIQKLDPQETIRNFLNYQHVDSIPQQKPVLSDLNTTNLPPPNHPLELSPPAPQSYNMAHNLRNLPKLTIPVSPNTEEMTTAVTTNRSMTPTQPSAGNGSPTAIQRYGPFTQNTEAVEYYRQGTPFTEVDVPITAVPNGPIARDASQSVPPDMQYGTLFLPYRDPILRSTSVRPRAPQSLRKVHEDKPLTPIDTPADLIRSPRAQQHGFVPSQSSLTSDPEVTQSGYMKKRKTTRLLRHEWQDAHFTLRGTNLAMHKDEQDAHRESRALEIIDVDDYAVACSSVAGSSKLSAAFKKSVLRNGNGMGGNRNEPAFAFSLVPSAKEGEKKSLFNTNGLKPHHFAVKSRDERIEWMRTVMIAKIAGRKGQGEEISVNGQPI